MDDEELDDPSSESESGGDTYNIGLGGGGFNFQVPPESFIAEEDIAPEVEEVECEPMIVSVELSNKDNLEVCPRASATTKMDVGVEGRSMGDRSLSPMVAPMMIVDIDMASRQGQDMASRQGQANNASANKPRFVKPPRHASGAKPSRPSSNQTKCSALSNSSTKSASRTKSEVSKALAAGLSHDHQEMGGANIVVVAQDDLASRTEVVVADSTVEQERMNEQMVCRSGADEKCGKLEQMEEVIVDLPAVPEVVVDLPAVPKVVVDLLAVPEVVVDLPAVPEVVDLPAVPKVVDLPAVPEVVNLPAVPEVVDLPAVPKVVDLPAVSEVVVDLPALPEIVDLPAVPKVDAKEDSEHLDLLSGEVMEVNLKVKHELVAKRKEEVKKVISGSVEEDRVKCEQEENSEREEDRVIGEEEQCMSVSYNAAEIARCGKSEDVGEKEEVGSGGVVKETQLIPATEDGKKNIGMESVGPELERVDLGTKPSLYLESSPLVVTKSVRPSSIVDATSVGNSEAGENPIPGSFSHSEQSEIVSESGLLSQHSIGSKGVEFLSPRRNPVPSGPGGSLLPEDDRFLSSSILLQSPAPSLDDTSSLRVEPPSPRSEIDMPSFTDGTPVDGQATPMDIAMASEFDAAEHEPGAGQVPKDLPTEEKLDSEVSSVLKDFPTEEKLGSEVSSDISSLPPPSVDDNGSEEELEQVELMKQLGRKLSRPASEAIISPLPPSPIKEEKEKMETKSEQIILTPDLPEYEGMVIEESVMVEEQERNLGISEQHEDAAAALCSDLPMGEQIVTEEASMNEKNKREDISGEESKTALTFGLQEDEKMEVDEPMGDEEKEIRVGISMECEESAPDSDQPVVKGTVRVEPILEENSKREAVSEEPEGPTLVLNLPVDKIVSDKKSLTEMDNRSKVSEVNEETALSSSIPEDEKMVSGDLMGEIRKGKGTDSSEECEITIPKSDLPVIEAEGMVQVEQLVEGERNIGDITEDSKGATSTSHVDEGMTTGEPVMDVKSRGKIFEQYEEIAPTYDVQEDETMVVDEPIKAEEKGKMVASVKCEDTAPSFNVPMVEKMMKEEPVVEDEREMKVSEECEGTTQASFPPVGKGLTAVEPSMDVERGGKITEKDEETVLKYELPLDRTIAVDKPSPIFSKNGEADTEFLRGVEREGEGGVREKGVASGLEEVDAGKEVSGGKDEVITERRNEVAEQEGVAGGREEVAGEQEDGAVGWEKVAGGPKETVAGQEKVSAVKEKEVAEQKETAAEQKKVTGGQMEVVYLQEEVNAEQKKKVNAGQEEVTSGQEEMTAGPEEIAAVEEEVTSGQEEMTVWQDKMAVRKEEESAEQFGVAAVEEEVTVRQKQMVVGEEEKALIKEQMDVGKDEVTAEQKEMVVGQEGMVVGQEGMVVGQEGMVVGKEGYDIRHEKIVIKKEEAAGQERVVAGQEEVTFEQEEMVIGKVEEADGQERVAAGEEEVITGQEEMVAAKEEVTTGQEGVIAGQEEVIVGQDEVIAGQEGLVVCVTAEAADDMGSNLKSVDTDQQDVERHGTDEKEPGDHNTIAETVDHQGAYDQGTSDQVTSHLDTHGQETLDQVTSNQNTCDQGISDQITYNQFIHNQGTYDQDKSNQITYDQVTHDQVTHNQDTCDQDISDQITYDQVTHDQDLCNQDTFVHEMESRDCISESIVDQGAQAKDAGDEDNLMKVEGYSSQVNLKNNSQLLQGVPSSPPQDLSITCHNDTHPQVERQLEDGQEQSLTSALKKPSKSQSALESDVSESVGTSGAVSLSERVEVSGQSLESGQVEVDLLVHAEAEDLCVFSSEAAEADQLLALSSVAHKKRATSKHSSKQTGPGATASQTTRGEVTGHNSMNQSSPSLGLKRRRDENPEVN